MNILPPIITSINLPDSAICGLTEQRGAYANKRWQIDTPSTWLDWQMPTAPTKIQNTFNKV